MFKKGIFDVSPKEYRVMLALYEYRGVTIDQLLEILGYDKTGITNMYKPIQSLTELGYISAYAISPRQSKKIYFLSPKGYSKMLHYLSIPEGYHGSGFNKDYGDFPYDGYKPPEKLKIHHLYLVEFLIKANKFKLSSGDTIQNFDFRDNRYASYKYKKIIEKEGAKPYESSAKLRPDAELKIKSKTCFIEIDLGTERFTHLKNKFEGYKEYFQHCKEVKKPLPTTIMFISEEFDNDIQKNRRWQTISRSFLEILGEYSTFVNLVFESIDKVEELLLREYSEENYLYEALENIKNFEGPNSITMQHVDRKNGPFKWGTVNFHVSKQKLYPFIRVEGYETKGWSLLWRFRERMLTAKINNKEVTDIIPVFLYKNNPATQPKYYSDIDTTKYYNKRLHFKSRGQFGTWQNHNLDDLTENPLKN